MTRGQGDITAPATAAPGEQITIEVTDGSKSITVHLQGTTDSSTHPVGTDGKVRITIPQNAPNGGIYVIAGDGVPPASAMVEVVTAESYR